MHLYVGPILDSASGSHKLLGAVVLRYMEDENSRANDRCLMWAPISN